MATHSSVLAWRIPGMGEPGGLPPMGSHRVGHNWSDSAAVAASSDLLGFGWSRLSSVIASSVSSLSLPLSFDAWVWSSHVLLMAKTSGTVQSSLGPWVGGHTLSLLRTLHQNVGQTLVYELRTHSAPRSRDSRATWQRTGWKMLIIQPITRLRMAVHHGALLVWETLLSLGAEPPSMSLLHLEMMPGSLTISMAGVMKHWCFWTVVLEKTLESPLNYKEIKTVNPNGNQSWIVIGRTDDTYPSDAKSWLIRKDPHAGKEGRQEEKGVTGRDGCTASLTQWTQVWALSGRWWRIGKAGML